MMDLEDLPQMNLEWRAWRSACCELAKLGVDINKEKDLAHALKRWGEELVALRARQTPDIVEHALTDARHDYPDLLES